MYLFILDLPTYNLIYTSYYISSLDKEPFSNVKNYHKKGILLNPEKYQIGIHEYSGLIFTLIHYSSEIPNCEKTEEKTLTRLAKEICHGLDENNLIDLLNVNRELLYHIEQFIESKIFPWDTSLRVIGQFKAGKSTISRLFFSYCRSGAVQNVYIPYDKDFSGKKIKIQVLNWAYDSCLYGIRDAYKEDTHFLLVLDSTNIKDFTSIQKGYLANYEEEFISNKKILIIANKQDLPNAISPKIIEKELRFPTIGFSAIAPDAPERLEQIITEFLKDK